MPNGGFLEGCFAPWVRACRSSSYLYSWLSPSNTDTGNNKDRWNLSDWFSFLFTKCSTDFFLHLHLWNARVFLQSPGLSDRHWHVPCWCTQLGTNPIECQMHAVSPTAVTLPRGCDLKGTTRRNLQEITLPWGADSCTIGKIRLLLSIILFAISAAMVWALLWYFPQDAFVF